MKSENQNSIIPFPIIDLFAGPGGLAEGFSSVILNGVRFFKIKLSIEKEENAHRTLELRSFCRQFSYRELPEEYYNMVRESNPSDREAKKQLLYKKFKKEYKNAQEEAWKAELGSKNFPPEIIDKRIDAALNGFHNWVLIGGPPCQAYSIVGRSRRQEKLLDEKTDERVGLYKQYLRILAIHNPAIFVMENVKGLLSAKTAESPIFSKILNDLSNPVKAFIEEYGMIEKQLICPGYKIFSFAVKPSENDNEGNPVFNQKDFVIKAENYGVPQTRHRVILLGIRKGINLLPEILTPAKLIPISNVLSGMPKIRSGISKSVDSSSNWLNIIKEITNDGILMPIDDKIKDKIYKEVKKLTKPHLGTGVEFISYEKTNCKYMPEWYLDTNLKGMCSHSSRSHMKSDLLRYFFASCYAKVLKDSPKLENFPFRLLPDHKNINEGIGEKKFSDRFRVQLWNEPSKTITSHISKDGHYYIHPNPSQCRSFTVREAARIQTFPDNYFFYGARTAQFQQVGNAVPPYLAYQIAEIVSKILMKL